MPWAASEGRRIALVAGEAGSGKSRLVREFAQEAAAGGALVLYGACDAVVPTPYGPFAEALGRLARTVDPARLRDDLGPGGGELQRLLPDLAARVGELPEPDAADQDTERHRLLTAVVVLLIATGTGPPIRRSCSSATSGGPRPTPACSSSRRSVTPRPTCHRSSATRWSTCAGTSRSPGYASRASRPTTSRTSSAG